MSKLSREVVELSMPCKCGCEKIWFFKGDRLLIGNGDRQPDRIVYLRTAVVSIVHAYNPGVQ